ncbi:DeoR/GlpR family DNA-binding transcription regulator, partial [Staphylococcus epidermidis]
MHQNPLNQPNLSQKTTHNLPQKQQIPKPPPSHIQHHQSIFLHPPSSTFHLIQYIHPKHITLLTNPITHLQQLLNHPIKTLMLPPQLKPTTIPTLPPNPLQTLTPYSFHPPFIPINPIDLKYPLTTPHQQQPFIKQTPIKLSNHKYLLLHQSNFNQIYFPRLP